MKEMQKSVEKLSLNVIRRMKISLKVNDLDLPKMAQIMFLIRWCNLIGFSCMEECFIPRNQIWKLGYQAVGLQKIGQMSKKL
jgi:hypothetical protein